MKALILTILLFTTTVNAQISVSQGFVDDATKAFIELRAERAVSKAQEAEIQAKSDLIKTQSLLIESMKQSIESRDAQIAALAKIKCDKTKFFWGIISKQTCR